MDLFLELASLLVFIALIILQTAADAGSLRRIGGSGGAVSIVAVCLTVIFLGFVIDRENGGIVGALAFAMAAVVYLILMLATPYDPEDRDTPEVKKLRGVRAGAGIGMFMGVVATLVVVLSSRGQDFPTGSLLLPFFFLVVTLFTFAGIETPKLGLVYLLMAGVIVAAFLSNQLKKAREGREGRASIEREWAKDDPANALSIRSGDADALFDVFARLAAENSERNTPTPFEKVDGDRDSHLVKSASLGQSVEGKWAATVIVGEPAQLLIDIGPPKQPEFRHDFTLHLTGSEHDRSSAPGVCWSAGRYLRLEHKDKSISIRLSRLRYR